MRFAGIKTVVALSLAFSAAMWQVPSAEAFSAQDAIGAVNEATQDPELMYTIYIGMPESEVAANLRGVDGQNDWELTSRSNSTSRHDFVTYQLARGAANMKQVKEIFLVNVTDGYVKSIRIYYRSGNPKLITPLYQKALHNYGKAMGASKRRRTYDTTDATYYQVNQWQKNNGNTHDVHNINYSSGDFDICTGEHDTVRTLVIDHYHY